MQKKQLILVIVFGQIFQVLTTRTNISYWGGRFGNHIFQIINACVIAKNKQASVSIPKHSSSILSNITNRTFTFGPNRIPSSLYFFETISLEEKLNILEKTLLPLFTFSTPHKETQETSIVIHVRTGDIWDTNGTEPWSTQKNFMKYYIQPPLAFYQTILELHPNITTVVLIMDHKGTPGPVLSPLKALLKEYKKNIILYGNASMEEDFSSLVLTQGILVHSLSTFTMSAGLINYLTTQNSIQYLFKFIEHDFLEENHVPENREISEIVSKYNKRIKVISIGGAFGKQVVNLQRNAGKSDYIPRQKVMELYQKPYPATIYLPPETKQVD